MTDNSSHAAETQRSPLRTQAQRHLRRQRHARPTSPHWACEDHRIPAGERCSLCLDQVALFDLPGVADHA